MTSDAQGRGRRSAGRWTRARYSLRGHVWRRLGIKSRRAFLFFGHPRSGTGYAAACARRWGWDVGHEEVGRHGVSAWYAGLPAPPILLSIPWDTYEFGHRVHVLRRAAPSIASIAFTEASTDRYRFEQLGLRLTRDRIEDAITSLREWTSLLERRHEVDFRFRIEENGEELFNFMLDACPNERAVYSEDRRRVNARGSEYSRESAVDAVLAGYREVVDELDERFGYQEPWTPHLNS